ncbi:PQQ-dependent catabolism-associated CXXCW motif protein [Paracoccus sp. MBLB3053]|uniref:PQQ-dependent catabolism-associated CXXCW motif protein n=1 Tax=Paracoccus aurantius TaxID=3073814 RepID=A0ABU2HP72_9RHOB|nr:PQQ-dependent catabolism-associated CXXCW motif protein [Paracoccus sp. MBLB3053]MDS9466838.1 PQQ-dependent catabolism-associated CXXCW motif protein [Paracoccus sp. MBLB3053]
MRFGAVIFLILTAGGALAQVPEPQNFHGEPYRSEVPATLSGARVVDTAEAIELHDSGVPFVDVMPRKARPEGLPDGTIWAAPAHMTITGATWLFDTGYERISPIEEQRLAEGLAAATKGDKTAQFVIFCRRDCWMSWNAGKRAVDLGYTGVIWFPDGSDGWQEAGRDLVIADVP